MDEQLLVGLLMVDMMVMVLTPMFWLRLRWGGWWGCCWWWIWWWCFCRPEVLVNARMRWSCWWMGSRWIWEWWRWWLSYEVQSICLSHLTGEVLRIMKRPGDKNFAATVFESKIWGSALGIIMRRYFTKVTTVKEKQWQAKVVIEKSWEKYLP